MWRPRRRTPPSAWRRRRRAGWPHVRAWAWRTRCGSPASSTGPVAERDYDIVLFGATGFTGALTAEYLARNAGPDTRWALAGRSQSKLEEVRRRLGSEAADVPLLPADATDPGSLRSLA